MKKQKRPMKGFSRITFGSDDEAQQAACSKCGKFACFCLHDFNADHQSSAPTTGKAESKKRKMEETEQEDFSTHAHIKQDEATVSGKNSKKSKPDKRVSGAAPPPPLSPLPLCTRSAVRDEGCPCPVCCEELVLSP
jgi:hypothetical protein